MFILICILNLLSIVFLYLMAYLTANSIPIGLISEKKNSYWAGRENEQSPDTVRNISPLFSDPI